MGWDMMRWGVLGVRFGGLISVHSYLIDRFVPRRRTKRKA